MVTSSSEAASEHQVTPIGDSSPAAAFDATRASAELNDWLALPLLGLFAFFSGISIFVSQGFMFTILGLGLFVLLRELRAGTPLAQTTPGIFLARNPRAQLYFKAGLGWLAVVAGTSLFGIDPLRSLGECGKLLLSVMFPIVIATQLVGSGMRRAKAQENISTLLLVLMLGQAVAAGHTLLTDVFQRDFWPSLPGPVTESGQLVFLVLASLALLLAGPADLRPDGAGNRRSWSQKEVALGAVLLACCLGLAWPEVLIPPGASSQTALRVALTIGLAAAMVALLWKTRSKLDVFKSRLIIVATPLLLAAFIINLKRGPWLGVFVAAVVLGLLVSRRVAVWAIAVGLVVLLTFEPVQTRLFQSSDDFSISGGRRDMWQLGFELVERYPLGLGLKNVRFMRELEPTLPLSHRHMHNNYLNVAVETGWLGLAAYLCFIGLCVALGFLVWRSAKLHPCREAKQLGILALGLSCGTLGWQVAGIVEYNFGDGEVRFIAFLFLGLILAIDDLLRDPAVQQGSETALRALPKEPGVLE